MTDLSYEERSAFNPEIFENLAPRWQGRWQYLPSTSSTNTLARERLFRESSPEEFLIVADEQTAGKGRLGRVWNAPPRSGLLCTLTCPLASVPLDRAFLFTASLGLSIKKAVGKLHPETNLGLKWPNDLIRDGKKTGGILAELENGLGHSNKEIWLVLGFGLNISLTSLNFSEAGLTEKAINLTTVPLERENLLAGILSNLELYRSSLSVNPEKVWSEWASSLLTIGQKVKVSGGTSPKAGVLTGNAVGVREDGALIVQEQSGILHFIQAGDVSVRMADGRYSA